MAWTMRRVRPADHAGDNKNMKTKQDVIETMKSSIDAVIGDDKNHGWGQNDSMAVVGDLLAEFAPEMDNEVRQAVLAGINQVVNPSACRQWLESEKVGKLNKQESGRSKSTKLFAQFWKQRVSGISTKSRTLSVRIDY